MNNMRLTVKQLRKFIKATPNFNYAIEFINFLNHGKIERIDGEIPCASTNLRSLKGIYYELFDWRVHKWVPITEVDCFQMIHKHKTNFVKIRNRKPKVYKDIQAADLFHITDHFRKQVAARFQHFEEGPFSAIDFLLKHGYRITENLRADYYAEDKFVIYEPVTNMYAVAIEAVDGIILKTTFESGDHHWFQGWLKNNTLKNDMLLLKYVRETFEVQEVLE